jgi:crotonobetainyl-CoA:carnitine CoA-transferase CaiB-like acyl-CoA transferase
MLSRILCERRNGTMNTATGAPSTSLIGVSLGSLNNIKVIDLSRVLGGPYCTQILADHGADVLKIEPPQGDETRGWGPPFNAQGTASYFLGLNRNKRGATMDLNDSAQRDALRQLLLGADVLVENFKTGSMEKWGLGFDSLHAQFPRLVHCRVSGFGADGPLGGLLALYPLRYCGGLEQLQNLG